MSYTVVNYLKKVKQQVRRREGRVQEQGGGEGTDQERGREREVIRGNGARLGGYISAKSGWRGRRNIKGGGNVSSWLKQFKEREKTLLKCFHPSMCVAFCLPVKNCY